MSSRAPKASLVTRPALFGYDRTVYKREAAVQASQGDYSRDNGAEFGAESPRQSVIATTSFATVPSRCTVTNSPPVCLQNYTGDRLNFGLAAEQAKAEGYKVEVSTGRFAL